MTVREMIFDLRKCDPDLEVIFDASRPYYKVHTYKVADNVEEIETLEQEKYVLISSNYEEHPMSEN